MTSGKSNRGIFGYIVTVAVLVALIFSGVTLYWVYTNMMFYKSMNSGFTKKVGAQVKQINYQGYPLSSDGTSFGGEPFFNQTQLYRGGKYVISAVGGSKWTVSVSSKGSIISLHKNP